MMSFDPQALFFQTDLTNWITSFPLEYINKCPEPLIETIQCNRILRKFISSDQLIKKFSTKKSNKYPWRMEFSPDGLYLVILKNNNVELRSSKLDFSNINFQCQVYRDMYPQWRCIAWANLSNYFATTFSNGMCNIWDIQGSRLVFKFMKSKDFDPAIKVILLNITKGKLKIYILTLKRKVFIFIIHNFKIISSFESTIDFLSTPILCSEVSISGNLLVLGTYNQAKSNDAFKSGIISCRLIDEAPFIVPNINKNDIDNERQSSWIVNLFLKKTLDGVYSIEMSKNNEKLAALHLSGLLSIWKFPSLKLLLKWQPSSIFTNPVLTTDFLKNSVMPTSYYSSSIYDICWWNNNDYIVIGLQNGRIVILNMNDKSENGNINLLPFSQLQESQEKSFFSLSCVSISSDEDSVQPITIPPASDESLWKHLIKYVLSFLPDFSGSDLYHKRHVPMSSLKFQLSRFQLTSPAELFDIEINRKRYREALELAEKYSLDVDLVYQKQWRDSDKTPEDIDTILVRISKRNWILNECLERIPEQLESYKYLLELGLRLTNFTELAKHQHGLPDNIDQDFFDNTCGGREQIDQDPNMSELTLTELELVRIRIKLLSFCDKLSVYERICVQDSVEFQRDRFQEIRNLSPFELAITFAHAGRLGALRELLDFYRSILGEHILAIFWNVPECIEPRPFLELCFEFLNVDQSSLTPRQLDWTETGSLAALYRELSADIEAVDAYYNRYQDQIAWKLLGTCMEKSRSAVFTDWLELRVRAVEKTTLNADFALELARLGQERDLSIDSRLLLDLELLCVAIYQCRVPDMFVTLLELASLSPVAKARLLLAGTERPSFLARFRRFVLPFVRRLHGQSPISFFFDLLAPEPLCNVRQILEDSQCVDTILNTSLEFCDLVTVVIELLLDSDEPGCESNQDDGFPSDDCVLITRLLSNMIASRVAADNELKERDKPRDRYHDLQSRLETIENYVALVQLTARLSGRFHHRVTIKYLHDNRSNPDAIEKVLVALLHDHLKRTKPVLGPGLESLFTKVGRAVSSVFRSALDQGRVSRLLVQVLLESGDRNIISLATQFLELSNTSSSLPVAGQFIDYDQSVSCIAMATRTYIDSSTSSTDSNFELARFCVNLVTDHPAAIEAERDLIRACEFLDRYRGHTGLRLVPVEVRATADRFELLRACMNADDSLYRQLELLVEAASFMSRADDSGTSGTMRFRQGEVLRLAARKALVVRDWDTLEVAMNSLVHRNHKPCWSECVDCVLDNECRLDNKRELAHYAIASCPPSDLVRAIGAIKKLDRHDNIDYLKKLGKNDTIKKLNKFGEKIEISDKTGDSSVQINEIGGKLDNTSEEKDPGADGEINKTAQTDEIQSVMDTKASGIMPVVREPMRLLAFGLGEIGTKLALKSLIDKSSDTLAKLLVSGPVVIGLGGLRDIYSYDNRLMGIDQNTYANRVSEIAHPLIYQPTRSRITLELATTPLDRDLRSLSELACVPGPGTDCDELQWGLARANLARDSRLAVAHALCVNDIVRLHSLRHEMASYRFSRALMLSMVEANLVFHYQPNALSVARRPLCSLQSVLSDDTGISQQLTDRDRAVLNEARREYFDQVLVVRANSLLEAMDTQRFFSSVDYRREVIVRLADYRPESGDAFRLCLELCDRYRVERRLVNWQYLISFLADVAKKHERRTIPEEETVTKFNSVFCWRDLLGDPTFLARELESYFTSSCDGPARLTLDRQLRVFLSLIARVDDHFEIFGRPAKTHFDALALFDSICLGRTTKIEWTYLDLLMPERIGVVTDAIRRLVTPDNLCMCSELLGLFGLSHLFDAIRNEFSAVLASQALWPDHTGSDLITDRFRRALEQFSPTDGSSCYQFVQSTLFELRPHDPIDIKTKIHFLNEAQKWVTTTVALCSVSCPSSINEWRQLETELAIWSDHIQNTVTSVVEHLESLPPAVRQVAEYLGPDDFWGRLLQVLLESGVVSLGDFFTVVWNANIESELTEEAVALHICKLAVTRTTSCLDELTIMFNELGEYLDTVAMKTVITTVLEQPDIDTSPASVRLWLLQQLACRAHENRYNTGGEDTVTRHVEKLIRDSSGLSIDSISPVAVSRTSSNLGLINSLIGICESVEHMGAVGPVIELIELVREEQHLWQCWVKTCVIKGPEYGSLVYGQFESLKHNPLYTGARFEILIKDAIRALTPFNPADAISLLILKDPVESITQIQSILTNLKSDPSEYANAMKHINVKSLQIITDLKLIPIYAKTSLFQRLVNFITKDIEDPRLVNDVLEQLKQNGLRDEATWLASSSSHINPAMKTIEMVSGFWKRFSGNNS